MAIVTSLHIDVTDEIAEELAHRAESAGITLEELAAKAVASYVGKPRRTLSFVGLGASGRSDISENVDRELRSIIDK